MGILNTAITGLNAQKVALDVTAQNVANVATEGYTRQRVNFESLSPNARGVDVAGNGVKVTDIQRLADEFLIKQTWKTSSTQSYDFIEFQNYSKLEKVFGSDGLNLSEGFDKFYAALNEATIKPESTPLRQQVITEAESLGYQFNMLVDTVITQKKDLDEQISAAVSQSNTLIQQIAKLNKTISDNVSENVNVSELEDQRDQLVLELSELFNIKSAVLSNGSYQLTLANGQPLVIDDVPSTITVTGSNPTQLSLTIVNQNIPILDNTPQVSGAPAQNQIGGSVGAMANFQSQVLEPYETVINQIARDFGTEINTRLQAGFDLNGNAGIPLFSPGLMDATNISINPNISVDSLAFSSNPGAVGDNGNINNIIAVSNLTFANLPQFQTLNNQSNADTFASLLGEVAIKTNQSKISLDTSEIQFNQAISARNNFSAVNRDEEAAKLIEFTNAYQANMKVISTVNQLFDEILKIF